MNFALSRYTTLLPCFLVSLPSGDRSVFYPWFCFALLRLIAQKKETLIRIEKPFEIRSEAKGSNRKGTSIEKNPNKGKCLSFPSVLFSPNCMGSEGPSGPSKKEIQMFPLSLSAAVPKPHGFQGAIWAFASLPGPLRSRVIIGSLRKWGLCSKGACPRDRRQPPLGSDFRKNGKRNQCRTKKGVF